MYMPYLQGKICGVQGPGTCTQAKAMTPLHCKRSWFLASVLAGSRWSIWRTECCVETFWLNSSVRVRWGLRDEMLLCDSGSLPVCVNLTRLLSFAQPLII